MRNLRKLFFVRYGVALTLVLVAASIFLVFPLRSQAVEREQEGLTREARTLAGMLRPYVLSGDLEGLRREVEKVAGANDERVTVTDAEGTVLADSDTDPAGMDNHADRPEIAEAMRGEEATRIGESPTLDENYVYAAVPISSDGRVVGVVRVSMPEEDLSSATWTTWLIIVLALAVLLGLLFLVTVWIRKTLVDDLEALAGAAGQVVSDGEMAAMPRPRLAELQPLAQDLESIGLRVQEQYDSLRGEKEKLETILENVNAGILVLGDDGKVELINPAAERILGASRSFALGRSLVEIHPSSAIDRAVEMSRYGEDAEAEVEISVPRKRILRVRTSPVRGAARDVSGVICVLEDLTGTRGVERMRRDFVANVSHELRTPVANLRAVVEALRVGALEDREKARSFLSDIYDESGRLAGLVEDLLTLSRLEAAELAPQLDYFSLDELIGQVLEEKRLMAERYEVEMAYSQAGTGPLMRGDRGLIKTACANLLDNAVKYNRPGGRVEITVSAGDEQVKIAVTDDGIGIPARDRKRVFERFYRVDQARSRETGGTGLGLSIVKHVADLHGGSVSLTSTEGAGSTFTFTLPLRAEG